MSGLPVLRVRSDNAVRVTELTLDGIDLIPLHATGLTLEMNGGYAPHRATLTFEVIPDIELPAAVTRLMRTPDGVQVDDAGVPVTMLKPIDIPLDEDIYGPLPGAELHTEMMAAAFERMKDQPS